MVELALVIVMFLSDVVAFDHCMLQISWTWRVRKEKLAVTKDFKAMTSESWKQLDEEIGNNLRNKELQQDQSTDEGTDERLHRMNTCINDAVEKCVPSKKRLSSIKRDTSDETRRFCEVRTRKFSNMMTKGDKVTRQLRKR